MHFELLKSFAQEGPLTVVVTGKCMQGTMPEGSLVRLESRRKYWPGEVIAFKRGDGIIVCHWFLGYVPGRHGWRVITRAENSLRVDVPVPVRLVLGKVTGMNDITFQPGVKDRTRALLQYFAAIIRWPFERFGFNHQRHK